MRTRPYHLSHGSVAGGPYVLCGAIVGWRDTVPESRVEGYVKVCRECERVQEEQESKRKP